MFTECENRKTEIFQYTLKPTSLQKIMSPAGREDSINPDMGPE